MKRYWYLILLSLSLFFLAACQVESQPDVEALPPSIKTLSPTQAPSQMPTEVQPTSLGEIVYIGGDGNLYTYAPATKERILLTQGAQLDPGQGLRIYDFPTWSPSGDYLAYLEISAADEGGTVASLYLLAQGQHEPIQLYQDDQDVPFYLYWSPDGQNLSFLSSPKRSNDISLQIASLATGEVAAIDTGQPYYWAWAPEDDRVFVHTGGAASVNPEDAKLSFIDLNGETRESGLGVSPGDFQSPVYSPDGAYLLYAGETETGGAELILATAAGEALSALASVDNKIAFDWAPEGDTVAYLTGITRRGIMLGELALLDLSDIEDPKQIETEAQEVIAFFWSPDGRLLAYFVPVMLPEGDEFNASTERVQQRLQFELHVLEIESGESRLVTTFIPTSKFFNLVPYFDQYQRSISLWSPESDALVLSAVRNGNDESIIIVPIFGNRSPQTIANGSLAFWSWPR